MGECFGAVKLHAVLMKQQGGCQQCNTTPFWWVPLSLPPLTQRSATAHCSRSLHNDSCVPTPLEVDAHYALKTHLSVQMPSHSSLAQQYAPLCSQEYPSTATRCPAYCLTCTCLAIGFKAGSSPFIPIA